MVPCHSLIHENGVGDWNILFIVLCHSVTESSILPDSVICTYWHLWLILAVVSDLLGSGEVQLHALMKKSELILATIGQRINHQSYFICENEDLIRL